MRLTQLLINGHFATGTPCSGGDFLTFPTWYKYLPGSTTSSTTNGVLMHTCSPQFTSISDVWLIVAAVIEILLRIAALAAFGIIIYAGITYSTSSGDPKKTEEALNTIIYAAVGLAISVLAAFIVAFIAGSIK